LRDLEFARELSLNSEFCKGRDQAGICAVVMHDKLKSGISDPLIDSAQKEADKHHLDLKTAMLLRTIFAFKLRWSE